MKKYAVISTTYDDTYLFYLPIVTWAWNKLGIDVICFMPYYQMGTRTAKMNAVDAAIMKNDCRLLVFGFDAPAHKQATYAQCSRLYASALSSIADNDILITSDVDMLVFKEPPFNAGEMTILGTDLVPNGQFPMCYASAEVETWRRMFGTDRKTVQESLDTLLGPINAENFRGNYWSCDQEKLYHNTHNEAVRIPRARPGTQFASNRLDRDDAYFIDHLSPDIIDYHMHRPGYTEENFEKIIQVLQYFYPNDDLTWMREYREQYVKLIQ